MLKHKVNDTQINSQDNSKIEKCPKCGRSVTFDEIEGVGLGICETCEKREYDAQYDEIF